MRSIIANRTLQSHNLKINKILDVYRWIRQANEIYSQDVPDVQEMINLNQDRIQQFREKTSTFNLDNKSGCTPAPQN